MALAQVASNKGCARTGNNERRGRLAEDVLAERRRIVLLVDAVARRDRYRLVVARVEKVVADVDPISILVFLAPVLGDPVLATDAQQKKNVSRGRSAGTLEAYPEVLISELKSYLLPSSSSTEQDDVLMPTAAKARSATVTAASFLVDILPGTPADAHVNPETVK